MNENILDDELRKKQHNAGTEKEIRYLRKMERKYENSLLSLRVVILVFAIYNVYLLKQFGFILGNLDSISLIINIVLYVSFSIFGKFHPKKSLILLLTIWILHMLLSFAIQGISNHGIYAVIIAIVVIGLEINRARVLENHRNELEKYNEVPLFKKRWF